MKPFERISHIIEVVFELISPVQLETSSFSDAREILLHQGLYRWDSLIKLRLSTGARAAGEAAANTVLAA